MDIRMEALTGFQRDLLYVMAGLEKPSGQDIKAELEKQVSEINHGRLYPNLDRLVELGLVEKGQLDRRTNYYQISETGLDLIARRRNWESNYVDQDLLVE